LIADRGELDRQEAALQKDEADLSGLDAELSRAFAELRAAGAELSRQRQRVAKKLATEAQKQLADLGMKEARLDAALEPVPLGDEPAMAEVPAHGLDHLELMLAANRGEPARPLRKVASGGELSR